MPEPEKMTQEVDYNEIINQYRSDPFDYVDIFTPHTGKVKYQVRKNAKVEAPGGEWQHVPGTLLYVLTRERNPKPIHSSTNGEISFIRDDLDGHFVEAGEKILTIKHPLKKREIIENILRKVLYSFPAPERAKYFFSLDIQSRIEKSGVRSVSINTGDEILTMSLMKRDIPVCYSGEPGIIHSVYFRPGVTVDQDEPLIGVCSQEKLSLIKQIVNRVKAEWH